MNRQLPALPNPLVAELLELEAGTPVRLTFGTTHRYNRTAGTNTLAGETIADAVEAYYAGLGNLFGWVDARDDQPLAVRYRPPWSRYDNGRQVADLTAVEVLEHLTGDCETCKASFPITTKLRPRECPTCSSSRAATALEAAKAYRVGQAVDVHAMGHWYAGEVIKIGKTNVTVRYTSGAGVTRDKSCNPSRGLIRAKVTA